MQANPTRSRWRARLGSRPWSQQGISLIEVMITLAVLTLILGIGYPALADWLETYTVRTAAQELATNMQLQRMRAVSRNGDFSIDFDAGGGSYSLYEGDAATGTMLDVKPHNLPSGVVFQGGGGDAVDVPGDELLFHPDGSIGNSAAQDDTIHLTGTNGEVFRVVVNRATGRVSVEHS